MKKIILAILLVFIILVGIFLSERVIKIRNFECTSQYGPCSSNVLDSIEVDEGSLYQSKKAIREKLTNNRLIKDFDFRFIPPSTMTVFVIEKKAVVATGREGEGTYELITEEGDVLREVSETQLPKIITREVISDKEIKFLSVLLRELSREDEVREGTVDKDSMVVKLSNGPKVILPLEGDPDVLLGSLELILSWLNREGEMTRIGIVDLRYKNPVLREYE